jgi:His Kinase A (phospho-acceptor) domain
MILPLRYNDRLTTALAVPGRDAAVRAAMWVQIADLLAQDGEEIVPEQRDAALARLKEWRGDVPVRRRLASSVSLAGRSLGPRLVQAFADDVPQVAAPVLARALLSGSEWSAIVASFPPASRALLRERRDLPEEAMRALASFGTADFGLPRPEIEEVQAESYVPVPQSSSPAAMPISDLVRRIEEYRKKGGRPLDQIDVEGRPAFGPMLQSSGFAFETDSAGVICWVEGVAREPVIGVSLADLAEAGSVGVDGQATGAFRNRARFSHARLRVGGRGLASGDWVIAGEPHFDAATGRFIGYGGVARRPGRGNGTFVNGAPLLGATMQPASIRQLVHELRTPLNAIRGFAEMINGQFLGEAEPAYRERAGDIIRESGTLLRIFDDLDCAARLDSNAYAVPDAADGVDLTSMFRRLASEVGQDQKAFAGETMRAALGERDAERLCGWMLDLATDAGGAEGVAAIQLVHTERGIVVTAPADVGNGGAGLALGATFITRLISRLAIQLGGRFDIKPAGYRLILPALTGSSGDQVESS